MVDRWLPNALAERARAWLKNPGTPVVPRRAATVVLLRDTPTGPEVYLLRRASTMAFAATMYAFPGGAAESEDADIEATAIRETFEETGLRITQLHPWSRWVTPEFEARRYDAYFFISALPEGQLPAFVDGGEADHAVWLSPAEAVALHRDGKLAMLPPTVETLRQISQFTEVKQVIAASAEMASDTPIMPTPVIDGAGVRIVVPEESQK